MLGASVYLLLGVDSSLVRTPNSQELREHFSLVQSANQAGLIDAGFPEARMSVLYDLFEPGGARRAFGAQSSRGGGFVD